MKKNIWLLLGIILAVSACTMKDNPVGYDPVNEPKLINFSDNIISNVYSYEDTVKSYLNATVISLGNRGKYESRIFLRFYDLPDSLATMENEELTLKLVVNKQRNSENSTFHTRIVNQSWDQNYISWKTATDSLDWEMPFFTDYEFDFELNEIYATGDTVEVGFPLEMFYNYNQEDDKYYVDSLLVNYGITIMRDTPDTEGENILEFYSSESSDEYGPELKFSYKVEASDVEYTEWNSSIVYDGMFYTSTADDLEDFEVYGDSLILRNISPTKMFIGLDISLEDFIIAGDTTGINTLAEFNKMTVNRAELVLQAKSDRYFSSNMIYVVPYLLTDSTWVETPEDGNIPVYEEQFEYVSGTSTTSDSLESNEFRIDITETLQAYINDGDDIDGFGIIIFSARENRDFSIVRFYNQSAEESKQPYIELTYTPPLLP